MTEKLLCVRDAGLNTCQSEVIRGANNASRPGYARRLGKRGTLEINGSSVKELREVGLLQFPINEEKIAKSRAGKDRSREDGVAVSRHFEMINSHDPKGANRRDNL
jgi:hypothetical protein